MTSDERMDDCLLLQRVLAGDAGAAEALVDANLNGIFGLAVRMLGNEFDAEEVAQEAFLRLWRNAAQWRPEARIGTWLYRVTYNLCIDRLRRGKRVDPTEPAELVDDSASQTETVLASQQKAILKHAMDALPEGQRAALALVYFEELSNNDAANVMRISIKALESLLWRARKNLRQKLESNRDSFLG